MERCDQGNQETELLKHQHLPWKASLYTIIPSPFDHTFLFLSFMYMYMNWYIQELKEQEFMFGTGNNVLKEREKQDCKFHHSFVN